VGRRNGIGRRDQGWDIGGRMGGYRDRLGRKCRGHGGHLLGGPGARRNREADETLAPDLAAAREQARSIWAETLGQVEVEGGSARDQRLLYSTLYKAFLHPTCISDVDGRYRGLDGLVHQDGRPYYSDFSLWDTYRTLHPLLTLLVPDIASDLAQSLVRMATQWGGLPRWPMGTVDAGSMIGTPADPVLAGSLLKGASDFDVEVVWPYLWAHATGPVSKGGRDGIEDYLALGYVAADHTSGSVSRTEEFAWHDFALSNLADALGKTTEAARLRAQSRTLGALWDDSVAFFRGRSSDGSWVERLRPEHWEDYYVEGDAWQHLWLSPYPDLLAEIMGGRDALVSRLEDFFELSADYWAGNDLGYLLPLPYYWHGNEPDIHSAYLFAAAGRPAGTERWVDWVRKAHYDLGPAGLAGNDDAGTLSAWFVFSCLGLYPWAGSDLYLIGTPAFDRAVVHLPGGDLVIEAHDLGSGPYVQDFLLDGAPYELPWLHHSDIAEGASLIFTMGSEPSTWGEVDTWPL